MSDCIGVTVHGFRPGSFANAQQRRVRSLSATEANCSAEFRRDNHTDAEVQKEFNWNAAANSSTMGDINLFIANTTPGAADDDSTIPGYAIAILVIMIVTVVSIALLVYYLAYRRSFSYSFDTGF
ncbi:uncharacterized protein ACMZJ9_012090 [Mantella aurantiaca]